MVFHSLKEDAHKNEDVVAQELSKNVRILCWVMTGPENHQSKVRTLKTYAVPQKKTLFQARHVKATWGKRCNKLIFMSSMQDISLPAVKLDVKEGRNHLWGKTKQVRFNV